ncbi:MAG TPA: N-acetylglucosamine-6-phosphate deacetylase [Capsulimonadaceae bacterium]|jgi:N-acetylglucosamine-6-phosphate deacetylase
MTTIIKGDVISGTDVIKNGFVIVDNGKIVDVTAKAPSGVIDLDRSGFLVAPGFVDMHVHGGGGADFMDGTVDAVRTALASHARHGTTGLLATTITASRNDVDEAIVAIKEVVRDPQPGEARILGIHLEGPYICASRRGAQPLEPIRLPDVDEFCHWVELSGGLIREITLAAEVEGAIDFIRAARDFDVVCSIGHTSATAAQTLLAIDAGAGQVTHLFNAMRGLHHREPGTVGAALMSPKVAVELICDGVHLDPAIVRLAVTLKTPKRCVLITDAMQGADMPDGQYMLGGNQVTSANGIAAFADGTLAGSVLTMDRAFANIQKFAGVSAVDASLMASGVPARQIGAGARIGAVESGKEADLVVIDPTSGAVDTTLVGGITAYQR